MIRGQWNEISTECCYYSIVWTPNINWGIGRFQICLYGGGGGLGNFKITRGEPLVGEGAKNNQGDASNFTHRVSRFPIVEFLKLFWIFFGTGNELEKIPFFQACSGIVLEFRIFDNQLFRLQHLRLALVWISSLWWNIISILPKAALITGQVIS